MPLEAVEARRLYRQVADQLRNLIDSGEYAVGSRLPTERELAEQLNAPEGVPADHDELLVAELGRLLEDAVRYRQLADVVQQPADGEAPQP